MKRINKILYGIICFFLMISFVKAGSATIKVSSNKQTVVVGNTFTVTVKISSASALGTFSYDLDYNKGLLAITNDQDASVVGYVDNNSTTTKTYTYTMKALKSGTFTIKTINNSVVAFDESKLEVNTSSAAVKIITKEQLQASYSKNNYLSSLKVEGVELEPTFNKETMEYSITLENGVTEIDVSATKEDSKASLVGTGKVAVSEGNNKIEVKVTAENGNEKVYIINATVKELSPITVTVNNKEYSVVRKKGLIDPPLNYEEKNILMGEEDVLAYYNDVTKYQLVALKDSEGHIAYFTYLEDNKFEPYQELSFNKIDLILLPINKNLVNSNYQMYKMKINDLEVEGYRTSITSKFALLYGINVANGKKGLYLYDMVENTIQRYNLEEVNIIQDKLNISLMINIILIVVLVISLIILLIMKLKKHKEQKKA